MGEAVVRGVISVAYEVSNPLSNHSIVSWRALDIFYELTSVMAMPYALEAFIVYIVHQETCWQD